MCIYIWKGLQKKLRTQKHAVSNVTANIDHLRIYAVKGHHQVPRKRNPKPYQGAGSHKRKKTIIIRSMGVIREEQDRVAAYVKVSLCTYLHLE